MEGTLKLHAFHILHQTFHLLFTYSCNTNSSFIHCIITHYCYDSDAQIAWDLSIKSLFRMASVSFWWASLSYEYSLAFWHKLFWSHSFSAPVISPWSPNSLRCRVVCRNQHLASEMPVLLRYCCSQTSWSGWTELENICTCICMYVHTYIYILYIHFSLY